MSIQRTIILSGGLAVLAVWLAWVSPSMAQVAPAEYLKAGNTLYASGDYGKAILYYRAALEGDPRSTEAYQGLGNCYYAQGLKTEALECYEKSLALNPGNAQLAELIGALKGQTAPEAPQSPGSSPDRASIINVTGFIEPTIYDHTLSSEEIGKRIKAEMKNRKNIGEYIGSTSCEWKVEFDSRSNHQMISGNCYFTMNSISFMFYMPVMKVQIAKTIPEGTCLYYELKDNLNELINVEIRIHLKYRDILGKALRRDLVLPTRENPWVCKTKSEINATVKKKFDPIVVPILQEYENERRRECGLDKIEALEKRILDKCGGKRPRDF